MNVPSTTLHVRFFKTSQGHEPVREWLQDLPAAERRAIGEDLRTVQLGWPLGMPLVRKLAPGLWEVRVKLKDRIARIVFTVEAGDAVLLHGFIKKSQKTPPTELATAHERKRQLELAAK